MPKLFIGNATRQNYQFSFREAGPDGRPSGQLRTIPIMPGTQIAVPGDRDERQIDAILKQHAKYGIIAEAEIDRGRVFHGTCYSIGKPISAARLIYLMEGNVADLVRQGEETRRASAVAQNSLINDALTERCGQPIDQLDLTVQQENEDPKNAVPQMSEGITVALNPDAAPLSGQGRRRRAA